MQDLIEREASWARQGHVAHMILKMNALADQQMIGSLYRASQAGVRIDLIVRGICCLRPAVPGVSDNIRVRSIVGRFLEHSRTWYFRNGGDEEIYLGSADLMARNLDDRVEVMVRLEDAVLKRRIRQEILQTYLADNVKARELLADGRYVRVHRAAHEAAVNSQECLLTRLPAVISGLASSPLRRRSERGSPPTARGGQLRVDVRALVQGACAVWRRQCLRGLASPPRSISRDAASASKDG